MIIKKLQNIYYDFKSNKIIKNLNLESINISMFEKDILNYLYQQLNEYNFDKDINNFNYLKDKNLTVLDFLNTKYNHKYTNIILFPFVSTAKDIPISKTFITINSIKFNENFYNDFYYNYVMDILIQSRYRNILPHKTLKDRLTIKLFNIFLENIKNKKINDIYLFYRLKG